MKNNKLNSYDFDGTLTTGDFHPKVGVDIVLTGRCYSEAEYVYDKLKDLEIRGIAVFFNPLSLDIRGNHCEEARVKSAIHKVNVLTTLAANHDVTHYDDDPIQIKIIRGMLPLIQVVDVGNPDKQFYGEEDASD